MKNFTDIFWNKGRSVQLNHKPWYDFADKSNQNKRTKVLSNLTKLHPDDFLRTSRKDVLWTFPYGSLRNTKGGLLPTSWGRLLPTSLGRWNMTSWRRPSVTSWGRPHTILYETSCDVTYDVLRTLWGRWTLEVMRKSPNCLIFNSKGRVPLTS